MRIMFKQVGCEPVEMFVRNELKTYQNLIGGYIEETYLGNGVYAVADEDGLLKRLAPNIHTCLHTLVGPVIFVAHKGDNFGSLNKRQVEEVKEYCAYGGVR